MAETLTKLPWKELGDFIAGRFGLHFPPEKMPDLQRGLAGMAREFQFPSPNACAEWILSSSLTKAQLHAIASHLTVGETYFFRDKKVFSILARQILPELIQSRRRSCRELRLWSAGCCTGEEPYSLAILLRQIIPDLKDWRITILATDINDQFLRKAAKGVYGEWSFRESPEWIKDLYFRHLPNGRYEILPEIKAQVNFANVNLVEDALPSLVGGANAMDLIFCRNVLMYFTLPQMEKVVGHLHGILSESGWLVVSPSETSQTLFSQFQPVNYPDVVLYQRQPAVVTKHQAAAPPINGHSLAPPAPSAVTEVLPDTARPPADSPSVAEVSARALALRARSLADEGKFSEALSLCQHWIAAEKLSAPAHYLHAMILQELHDTANARAALLKAIYLQPEFALAHFALGNLARQSDRASEADRCFANALELLRRQPPDDILPDSGGLTNRGLAELISAITTTKNKDARQ